MYNILSYNLILLPMHDMILIFLRQTWARAQWCKIHNVLQFYRMVIFLESVPSSTWVSVLPHILFLILFVHFPALLYREVE
jgi:hypothetical protein